MKKTLLICLLAALVLVLFTGSAFALHTQDEQGTRCFRCHSTHQGVTGLLLSPTAGGTTWQDTYEVTPSTNCLACHDGTGSRSVTSMVDSNGAQHGYVMNAGVFNVSGLMSGTMPANMSAHNVGIATAYYSPINEAPGNKNLSFYETLLPDLHCSSCHNPHGTNGSHKYTQFNPNNSIDGKFYLEGQTKEGASAPNPDWATVLAAKPEVVTITLQKSTVNADEYVDATSAPWLRAYIYNRGSDHAERYIKFPVAVQIGTEWVFQRESKNLATVNFTVNALTGTVKFDGAQPVPTADTLTAKVFVPIRIKTGTPFTGTYYAEDGTELTRDVRTYLTDANYGNTVNRWCAACHGNYDISDRRLQPYTEDGVTYHGHNVHRSWSQTYATPGTVSGSSMIMNCFSCHFAHGTNADLMMDSLKQVVGSRLITGKYGALNDNSPANKRYFAGSVCIRCHYNSHGEGLVWDSQIRPEEYQWQ